MKNVIIHLQTYHSILNELQSQWFLIFYANITKQYYKDRQLLCGCLFVFLFHSVNLMIMLRAFAKICIVILPSTTSQEVRFCMIMILR